MHFKTARPKDIFLYGSTLSIDIPRNMESPGYLGAIQAFTMYEVKFKSVPLLEDGIDVDLLDKTLSGNQIKLVYTVPTFQNPSGITYSREKRKNVVSVIKKHNVIFV
ncbi:MAG: aminotransferase class I/II-fold pyridoxal phosphate-dependent enzyme, partial [Candidatus Methanoperedens sp.]